MPKYRVVGVREETPAEKALNDWFAAQVTESPRNLEEAARLIIGLVTGLIGLLLGVLSLTSDPPPAYLSDPLIRTLVIAAIGLIILAALAALDVILPRRWSVNAAQPETQAQVFRKLLADKSRSLFWATILFALGLLALGAVLIVALITVKVTAA